MPEDHPVVEQKPAPAIYIDQPVRCRRCDHLFKSYVYRIVNTPKEDTVLIDSDGDVVYDLVKVCPKCKSVYHWHTNDKTLVAHSESFERLMRHYRQSAIITDDNQSTG